jgi:mRNA export factor
MFGAATGAGGTQLNPNKDLEIASSPQDGISSLCFSSKANFLIGTCWDNSAYCWEINQQGAQPKASTSCAAPLLCSAWNAEGTGVFLGSCDKTVQLWDLGSNQKRQVAAHDAPVRHCAFIAPMSLLVTGSWDKTLRYWDTRQATPVHTQQLSERVLSMDCNHPLLVVGTADRKLHIINLQNPNQIYKSVDSPLKFQTRCVTAFPDRSGYLVGSIEGRVAVQHVDDGAAAQKNFTFKCHRDGSDIYSVNAINFHPTFGTFATAGSDGTYNFWDKDSKQRLKAMQKSSYGQSSPAPIPCSAFNQDGSIYAYALSYDWSRGYQEYSPQSMRNVVLLHQVQESEVKAKPKASATKR